MARPIFEKREDHVLKGHLTTIPHRLALKRFRDRINYVNGEISHYLDTPVLRQYGSVVESGPPAGREPWESGSGQPPGVTIELRDVLSGRGGTDRQGVPAAAGVSLVVPSGQSVALLSKPGNDATDLLDAIAGLARPRSGQVRVDGVAVDRLSGAELDRYHAARGLVSARFPLLPSLSVADNILAARLTGRVDAAMRERAARLVEFTGAAALTGPVHRLPGEEQWRLMIARALMPSPRLMLAEDPIPSLDPPAAARVLDVLMDAQAMFGFTLLLTASRLTTAARCQRLVSLVNGVVVEDELTAGDDPWTRGRVDRIG
jgi:predicted ABC-type transport system involved in lysophospholipase L1 biosynthesis ATPase subunit